MLKCLQNAKSVGKDFGTLSLLKAYNNIRKTRKNFITLVTTVIFYVFSIKSSLKSIVNLFVDRIAFAIGISIDGLLN